MPVVPAPLRNFLKKNLKLQTPPRDSPCRASKNLHDEPNGLLSPPRQNSNEMKTSKFPPKNSLLSYFALYIHKMPEIIWWILQRAHLHGVYTHLTEQSVNPLFRHALVVHHSGAFCRYHFVLDTFNAVKVQKISERKAVRWGALNEDLTHKENIQKGFLRIGIPVDSHQ